MEENKKILGGIAEMKECAYCGKKVETLVKVSDSFEDSYNVCNECKEKLDAGVCRVCGKPMDINIQGKCETCYQLEMVERQKRQSEVQQGLVDFDDEVNERQVKITESDFQKWLTMSNTFKPSDLARSIELKRLWIFVKLRLAGIYDNDVINENMGDLEILLNRCFSKLVGNKCRLFIVSTSRDMQRIKRDEIIDFEGNSYILKGLEE